MRYHTLPLVALVVTAAAAQAQDECTTCRKSVSGTIGVGVATLPRYVGSDEYRVVPMPVAQLEYRERVFLGGSPSGVGAGVGAYIMRGSSFTWMVDLNGSEGRPENRGDALAGMGKRSAASFAGTGVAYQRGFVSANAGISVGLGRDQGSYGTMNVSAQRQLASRWEGQLSTGATFADSRNMAFDFGVTGAQSATRRALVEAGDPRLKHDEVAAYSPGAGLKEARGSAAVAYLLTQRTRAVLFAQGTHLSDEAARSPLVRARTGATTGMALTYSF